MATRCEKITRSTATNTVTGTSHEEAFRGTRRNHLGNTGDPRESVGAAAHDAEHGAAASLHARSVEDRAGAGRRDHHFGRAGYRVPAHGHRKRVRAEALAASGHAPRPRGLSW